MKEVKDGTLQVVLASSDKEKGKFRGWFDVELPRFRKLPLHITVWEKIPAFVVIKHTITY
jgi:hypothetical protein